MEAAFWVENETEARYNSILKKLLVVVILPKGFRSSAVSDIEAITSEVEEDKDTREAALMFTPHNYFYHEPMRRF